MANGNEAARLYQDAATAQLSERVTNMGRRINDVEVEMRSGFNQLGASLNSSTNETRSSIAALSASMAERNRPQYQALGFALTVILAVGALAYWPIRESTNDLKVAVMTLSQETNRSFEMMAEKMVTREELDWRSQRGAEDRARTETAIKELREGDVSRAEWMERNRARDSEIGELSRRIDEVRQAMGSVYGTRDVLLDLRERLDRLERDRIGSQSGTMLR
jgi:chromosome segregation ATPase